MKYGTSFINQCYLCGASAIWVSWLEDSSKRVCMLSHVRLFVTPWTAARQAPLSTKFSRQEYWSGLPFPPSGDLPDPGTEPKSLASPALAAGFFATAPPGKPHSDKYMYMNIHNGIFTVARKWKQTKYPLMGER